MVGKTTTTGDQTAHHVGVEPTVNVTSTTTSETNGGPRLVAALLSLGQDLTTKSGALVQGRAPFPNPLEIVPTSAIPMMTPEDNTRSTQKKRKRSKSKDNDGNPLDFWHWLPPGETVGNWDVLCGRGGESNHYIGNKKYRKLIGERKEAYRKIDVKERKQKSDFVRSIVQHIKDRGGRFIDVTSQGKYYVVTDDKARKKISQALRETKVLKWLANSYDDDGKEDAIKKKAIRNKDLVCPFCKKKGHKTRIAKACLRHHEWLDMNSSSTKTSMDVVKNTCADNKTNMLVV